MELGLEPQERNLLLDILTNYLADLRMEIANTENFDLREQLKGDEALVKGIIARLEQARSVGG